MSTIVKIFQFTGAVQQTPAGFFIFPDALRETR
jgi:hypothetical protein